MYVGRNPPNFVLNRWCLETEASQGGPWFQPPPRSREVLLVAEKNIMKNRPTCVGSFKTDPPGEVWHEIWEGAIWIPRNDFLFVTYIFLTSMDLLDPFDLGDPGKRAISLCLANANPPWKIPISPWILAENPESKTPEFWLKRESTAFTRMVSRFSVAIQWMELLVVEIGWSEACQQGLMDAYGNDAWFNICFLFMYVHRKTWGDIPVWLGYW